MDFEDFASEHFKRTTEQKRGDTKTRKIILTAIPIIAGVVVITTIILLFTTTSVFKTGSIENENSSFTEDSNKMKEEQKTTTSTYTAQESNNTSNPSKIEDLSSQDLSSGVRSRIKRGDTIKFLFDGEIYEIFIDSVKSNSIKITVKDIPIFSEIKTLNPKKLDLNSDNYYDIEINVMEIIDFDAIIELKEISEYYEDFVFVFINETTNETIILEEIPEDQDTSGWIVAPTELVPGSCEKEGLVRTYIEYEITKNEDIIIDEKRRTFTSTDFCVDSRSYINYYCDEKIPKQEEIYCESKYDDCVNSQCIRVRYDRNLKKTNSPVEEASSINTCYLKTTNTVFWAVISQTDCEEIFIASKIYSKPDFINFLSGKNLDTSLIPNYFDIPGIIKITYNTTTETEDFSSLNSKLYSDKCEEITFQEINQYCFNKAGSKENNMKLIIDIINLLKDSSNYYSSNFVSQKTYDFIESKNPIYVDGEDPSLYDIFPGYNSNTAIGCTSGRLSSHKLIKNNNVIFICEDSINIGKNSENLAKTSSEIFVEFLNTLSGYESNQCDEVVIDNSYTITVYGPDNLTELPLECEPFPDPAPVLPDVCAEHEIEIIDISYEHYINMETLYGEIINFLYEMSKNNKLNIIYRQEYYNMAQDKIYSSPCSNGIPKSYSIPPQP